MNTPMTTENAAAMASAKPMENVETFRASSSRPTPSRREIMDDPPMPVSMANAMQMLNTGRINEAPATIRGSFVRPR